MASTLEQPPLAPPVKYTCHFGTRWEKEKAAAGRTFEFPEDPSYIGQWIIGECVGKGASGRVRIAKHRRTGQLAAVKIVPIYPVINSRTSLATQKVRYERQRLGIDREIIMMKLMNHPNILRIYDVFEGERELYLILEYVEGGELFDFLVNCGRLRSLEALSFFKQIVYGLNYAHTFSIIHRDLKPENILIHSLNPPLIKIADWGMAAFAPPALQLDTSCGSPHYASPEIVNGVKYKGNASDIWSCGVILFALLAGRLPFDDKNLKTLLYKVKAGKYTLPDHIDPLAKDLITRMLVVDVNRRITIPEIMTHPWFNKPTPGIVYVPAPSVDKLALPLASPSCIDPDLLESLRVIWGKHGDIEKIRADLLSPAGEGTSAKAFYFLLQLYREQTLKDNGIILDVDDTPVSPGVKVITKQYRSPPPKTRIEAKAMAGNVHLQSSRDPPQRLSHTPSPQPSRLSFPSRDGALHGRPASPIGPRPPRVRPVSSRVREIPTRHMSMKAGHVTEPENVHPDLFRRTRASTASFYPRANQDPHSYLAHNQQMFQPLTVPTTPPMAARFPGASVHPVLNPCIVRPPVPVSAIANERVSANSRDIEMQPATGSDMDWVNIHEWHNVIQGCDQAQTFHPPTQSYADTVADHHGYVSPRGPGANYGYHQTRGADKENQQYFQRPYLESNTVKARGGIFGGRPNEGRVRREWRNTLPDAREVMKENEKKLRPPALDLHHPAQSSKRVLGPSVQNSSPAVPSILSFPVGEVKGWFSNLFNWKGHTYVLYSTDTVHSTRKETIRILERFGVIVGLEEMDRHTVLRCHMSELVDSPSASVAQKQVRFRVEFSQGQGQWSPQLGAAASPRSPGHHALGPMSPTLRYGSSKLSLESEFACAIVLVQEKGSMSSFRALCRCLRKEWALDALRSPNVGAGPFVESQRFAM
ncbi:Pkinase-domain-containing protein [Rhizopogon vinicolor AM-OR11-026]|uniref:Pkinase-domain-containing protein n=1 Tax=Rhizopogon vinicolor AM-OR11-026 TaxID=1314800 RepID=A0A1B7NC75_9AGAM|nr:Pkinase-domain-containing protein [Rhizopogon vinicolor AM-OR11-026]